MYMSENLEHMILFLGRIAYVTIMAHMCESCPLRFQSQDLTIKFKLLEIYSHH